MVKFKNVGDECSVYAPAGSAHALLVDHGDVVQAAGDLAADGDDAYLVEHNGEVRAWPKARWELVQDKPKPKAQPAPAEKE